MKRITLVMCLALFLCFLVTLGCATNPSATPITTTVATLPPVADHAQPTRTPITETVIPTATTPPPTSPPAPTPTIKYTSPTLTRFPASTPAQPPGAYRLAPWSEAAALELLAITQDYAQTVYESDFGYYRTNIDYYRYAQEPVNLAARELLLRYPLSNAREQVEWQLALAGAIMSRPEYDPDAHIIKLLTTGLNDGRYQLDTLAELLKEYGFTLSTKTSYNESLPDFIVNLFGDGEDGRLLLVSYHEYGGDGLILALKQLPSGYFELYPVYSYWAYPFSCAFKSVAAKDLTGDAIPEIIVISLCASAGSVSESIAILHWQRDRFVRLDDPLSVPRAFSHWHVNATEELVPSTIQTTQWQFYVNAEITTTYAWDGRTFVVVAREVETPVFSERDSPIYAENLHYAIRQGYNDFVATAVEHTLANWSDAKAESLGANYPDYLRFQLAMMHAYRSEVTAARQMLEMIIAAPANPVTPTISLATGQFLAHYQNDHSFYRACTAALLVMREALLAVEDGMGMALAALGINTWEPLCDLRLILKHQIRDNSQAGALQAADVPDFLRRQGISVLNSQRLDLDGNGRDDWLALLAFDRFTDLPEVELWAFLTVDNGVTAVNVTNYGSIPHPSDFTVTSAALPGLTTPAHFVQVEQTLSIIAFSTVLDEIQIRQWAIEQSNWRQVESFTLQKEGDSTQITIHFNSQANPPYNAVIAKWNPIRRDYDVVARRAANSLGIPLNEAAFQAERLLLEEADFRAAAELINTILTEPQPAYFYAQGISWPHLHYLLALAYELMGEADKAIQSYWHLWQNYPDTAYSLMAQRKLEHLRQ